MAALSIGGIAYVLRYPLLSGEAKANMRMARVSTGAKGRDTRTAARLEIDGKDQRRKQMQKTLKEMEENQKRKKKRVSLAMQLAHGGPANDAHGFLDCECCHRRGGGPSGFGFRFELAIEPWRRLCRCFWTAALGLSSARKSAVSQSFSTNLQMPIDVIIRGLKAGLPVNDTLKVISQESPGPGRTGVQGNRRRSETRCSSRPGPGAHV